jgi:hypothetical protein
MVIKIVHPTMYEVVLSTKSWPGCRELVALLQFSPSDLAHSTRYEVQCTGVPRHRMCVECGIRASLGRPWPPPEPSSKLAYKVLGSPAAHRCLPTKCSLVCMFTAQAQPVSQSGQVTSSVSFPWSVRGEFTQHHFGILDTENSLTLVTKPPPPPMGK